MNSLAPADLLTALNWRYAAKRFDRSRKIPEDIWVALEQTLVLSPSSFGLQPWKFVVVTDPATKERLVPACWGQTQPADCSHFVVFATRRGLDASDVERFLQRTVEVRGCALDALAGYRKVMLESIEKARAEGTLDQWQTYQVYIALGQFMASAAVLGVDTCPMEGIKPDQFDEILGLRGSGYATTVACAAGFRAANDKYASAKKVRFATCDVVRSI